MPNSNSYDIINGRKYKKCKPNQIRNPLTNRCVNIKTDKKTDKKISPIVKVLSKKNKNCPEGKVLNPLTNRCVKIKADKPDKKPAKKISPKVKVEKKPAKKISPKVKVEKKPAKKISPKAKVEKIDKSDKKKLLYPTVNRVISFMNNPVNANIDSRIKYYDLLLKTLNIDETKNYCLKLYKYDANNNPIFRIGNKIVLKKQLQGDNAFDIKYLSGFRDKYNKIFKYVVKITFPTRITNIGISIFKKLTTAILNHKCPHFPILYTVLTCDKENHNDSSYIKSSNNKISKTVIDDLNNYPDIIRKKTNIFILYELPTGNLKSFLEKYYMDSLLLKNALVQIYLSLLFFYQETNCFHLSSDWYNFLYHKVKPGGYFHYKIFGEDYYIENLGFLWVISEFEASKSFKLNNDNYSTIKTCTDLLKLTFAFFNISDDFIPEHIKITNGWSELLPINYKLNDNFKTTIQNIYTDIFLNNYYIRLNDIKGVFNIQLYNEDKHNKNRDKIYTNYFCYNDNIINQKFRKEEEINKYLSNTPENINLMINCIITTLKKNKLLSTQIKDKTMIINKNPYVLSQF